MKIHFRQLYLPIDWAWINVHLPLIQCEDTQGMIAVDSETMLPVGALVVDNITPKSVQAHFLATTPLIMRHGFLEECCEYVYEGMGKSVMFAQIPSNNDASLSVTEKMGFKVVCTLQDAFAEGVDYVIKEMRKEDCNFLPEVEHG